MAAFGELGVMPEITEKLDRLEWILPTEIQAEAIPLILGGGDILMASETGTGKTGAFCIPIIQVVYEHLLAPKEGAKLSTSAKKHQSSQGAMTFSVMDRDPDLVLSGDHLTTQSKSGKWQGCRANKGIKRLRQGGGLNSSLYYEVHFADKGLARVGWSFSNASLELGTDKDGYGYGGTAKKSNDRQFLDYGCEFGEKFDIVGCIMNLNSGEMSFTKNGRHCGVAFKIPLAKLESREIYPTICVKNAGCKARFGPAAEKNDYKPKDCIWISEAEQNLVNNPLAGSGVTRSGPLALILEPSRELAKQTFDCIETFSEGLKIETVLLVGGGVESKTLSSKTHIVVCTPGRLIDVTSKNQMSLSNIHFFILDEADGLLQQGSEGLIRSTSAKLPRMFEDGRRTQTICCSATLHNFQVKKLANDLMYFPTWIDLKGEDTVPDTVHHVVLRIDPKRDKVYSQLDSLFETDGVHASDNVEEALFSRQNPCRREELSEAIKLMKFYYTLKAIETLNMSQGIIFCRTKLDCDNLSRFMCDMDEQAHSNKYTCVRLHSSLTQNERLENLNKFKRHDVKFLICTDVAARGIDIKGVPFVIQVTLPDEKANYVHRIGRVGRAERMGLAISLVATEPEKVWYHSCRKKECSNTRLVERGGCCKWFDELEMLSDIEDHLKCTIESIEPNFKLQVNEFDGKVVYGSKKLQQTTTYEGHVNQLKSLLSSLTEVESKVQDNYLKLYM